MNYYILLNNRNLKGISTPVNAVLAETYKKEDPFPAMKYEWTKPRDFDRNYPSNLFFIVKGEKKFVLDYTFYWNGFIISQKFKDLLDKCNVPNYKQSKLTVVNIKGEDISNSTDYYFIEMRGNTVDAIDYNKSDFILDTNMIEMRGLTIDEVEKSDNYYGHIKKYEKISLKDTNVEFDIFPLKDIILHDLVCNEDVKTIIDERFPSIKVISLDNVEEYRK
ncbi:Imm43 family immunity protein (plasmid) [Bernardetia sp. Wsw4-3y2]|uniref:Imm43 family immunity protein n=1 Tax=Bernardetia sp. Wsw4-3y2 TaxID=3127471 RepID=UPI0030CD8312